MKQISLANAGFGLVINRTRKRVFLHEMNLVVPWTQLVELIQAFAFSGKTAKGGRPSFPVETMLRIHFLQQWLGLSDPAMEEALHDISLYCEFARLDPGAMRLPDETTILRFRHLLEEHNLSIQLLATINATMATKGLRLKTGTVVDSTLIAAPSSTKNSTGERDPEMHQVKKGNQWYFGMKAHIGVDAESGLVHSVIGTPANVNVVTQGHGLLHGEESVVFADAGYQGAAKREEATGVQWHVSMRPGKRRALVTNSPWGNLLDKAEQLKASVRAKVEHPFRVIKRQFGFAKVRYKGLAKNTAQLITLFALSNLRMARRYLMGAQG
jgi:transposase, IS5 family